MEQAVINPHSGIVTAVNGNLATIRFMRGKMCAHCGACLTVGEKELEMIVQNTLHAAVGDRVAVSIPARRVVQASLLAYAIPLVLLLFGVWLGGMISDLIGMLLGVLGCAIAFFILRYLEKKRRIKEKFEPRMTAILQQKEEDSI
ncbi:MAG: SoxR reducing system RseC family protein [Clostridia bacterium]